MADVIEKTESILVDLIVLIILGLFIWIIWEFRDFFGLSTGEEKGGKAQSIKNAGEGFPSGADPGTIPLFQYLQGLAESWRTLFNSSSDDEEYTEAQADSMTKLAKNYETPSSMQVDQAVQNFENFAAKNPIGTDLPAWAVQSGLF
jgi:hypothetical protein